MSEIQLVAVNQVDGVWPSIRHQIAASLKECDNLTVSGMYTFVRSGQGFLFVMDDLSASCIVGFEKRGDEEAARIYALASDKKQDWKETLNPIRKFAQANGALKVVFQGRKGWARALGIKPKYYHYEV